MGTFAPWKLGLWRLSAPVPFVDFEAQFSLQMPSSCKCGSWMVCPLMEREVGCAAVLVRLCRDSVPTRWLARHCLPYMSGWRLRVRDTGSAQTKECG
jgi:hypothetical protein